ncbi:MAG: hypothetical protein H0V87_10955 [Chloroflexi bacterium]|nr:hypothetical protein [Chloroflexota bacterium]
MRRAPAAALSVWLLLVLLPAAVAGAEPSPSARGGDPRSAGEGPGLVGDPLFALGLVIAIALATILVTTVWVRMTAERHRRRPPTGR